MKKIVPILAVVGILGLIAILLLIGGQQQPVTQPTDDDPTMTEERGDTSSDSGMDKDTEDGEDADTPMEMSDTEKTATIAELPTPDRADVAAALYSNESKPELKFVPEIHLEELDDAAISDYEIKVAPQPTYLVDWAEAVEVEVDLPGSAPLYLLKRPEGQKIYAFLNNISEQFDIDANLVRLNEQDYTLVDIVTGEYYLYYDLFHLTFDAQGLSIPVADGVADTLASVGLLDFPYSEEEAEDRFGNSWVRFTPDLGMPVVSLDTPAETDGFDPGKYGVVDVEVSSNNRITEIRNNFPNIASKGSVDLADAEGLIASIESGEFGLGAVELQYPGAIPVEDRRAFYEGLGDTINIADGEANSVECGYYLESGGTVQSVLAPVCIVNGTGMIDTYSVIFQGVVPAIQ